MFENIKGDWIKQNRLILCSCDEKYFKIYFQRFYTSFKDKWQLPIHVHIIDPSKQSLKWLNDENISHTWCNTDSYNWSETINKFKIALPMYKDIDIVIIKDGNMKAPTMQGNCLGPSSGQGNFLFNFFF